MCARLGIDTLLRVVSPAYLGLPQPKPAYTVSQILNFIAFLATKERPVQTDTIRQYVTHVRYHLAVRMVDVTFFEDPLIGRTVEGTQAAFRCDTTMHAVHRPKGERHSPWI